MAAADGMDLAYRRVTMGFGRGVVAAGKADMARCTTIVSWRSVSEASDVAFRAAGWRFVAFGTAM